MFPDATDPDDAAAQDRVETRRFWAEHLFTNGKGDDARAVTGTLWAAHNGVAEFVDRGHLHRPVTYGPDARRLQSAWFGERYRVEARAFEEAEARFLN